MLAVVAGWARLGFRYAMSVPGSPLLLGSLLMLAASAYVSEISRNGLREATLALAAGRAAWQIPGVPQIGVGVSAFVGLVLAVAFTFALSREHSSRAQWTAVAVSVGAWNASFTGGSIQVWVLPTAVLCALWGAHAFYKTWDWGAACRGTFALAFWAVFLGADTIRLWPNLPRIQAEFQPGAPLLVIGGVGWADALLYLPLVALAPLMLFMILIVANEALNHKRPKDPRGPFDFSFIPGR
ncbi:MAG: hypothetical protein HYT80_07990 [Euryarchaeota archaeon]|nr:hypothetical protein [Euryarchaeota archaeon]